MAEDLQVNYASYRGVTFFARIDTDEPEENFADDYYGGARVAYVTLYKVAPKGCCTPKGALAEIVACSKQEQRNSSGLGLRISVPVSRYPRLHMRHAARAVVRTVVGPLAERYRLCVRGNHFSRAALIHVSRGPVTREEIAIAKRLRTAVVKGLRREGFKIYLTDDRGGQEELEPIK